MVIIIAGIVCGAITGHLGNRLLFRKMDLNRRAGVEPLRGIGGVFFLRYGLDALILLLFYLITRDAMGLVAAALSITVAVKISLYIAFTRKGGRSE